MQPATVIVDLWGAFALSWLIAAAWSRPTEKRLDLGAQLPYRLMSLAGAVVLFKPAHGYTGPLRLWMVNLGEAWACAALIALGIAFAWWARLHLGVLWSGSVTKKAGHRIVDTGPYAIVRHPIYTGILAAVFGTVLAKGTMWGIAGAAIIAFGLWMKARVEERWLRQELGADAYDAYRRRVPMLVPFGPKAD